MDLSGSKYEHPMSNTGTIAAALLEGEKRLERSGTLRPRRHAELLLESVLGMDRIELYLQAGEPLSPDEYHNFERLLQRRESGEPVQFITCWTPFYGRRFLVGSGIFIPRFDSELLLERLLTRYEEDAPFDGPVEVLDLCCGCGVIGLTVAVELPDVRVTLSDISPVAVEYCARNALALLVNNRVDIERMDALADPPTEWLDRFRYVVANPPYIPVADIPKLHRDVRREPHEALTDGGDGLSFYRRWVQTLPKIIQPGGRIFVEVGDGAAEHVQQILSQAFPEPVAFPDLAGIKRVVEARL